MIWLVVALCGLIAGACFAVTWLDREPQPRFEDREQS